jgi:hypothetical protein
MRRPTKADFDAEVTDGGVTVTFRPPQTIITYLLLADPEDIAKVGPVSPDASVRHVGSTGDFGDYSSSEVLTVPREVAAEAVS